MSSAAPASDAGALLAPAVMEERRLPATDFERYFRERYGTSRMRKALFFALAEGPAAMLRKARSKRLERELQAAQEIVLARLGLGGRTLLGATRSLGGPLRFHRALLFEPVEDRALAAVELSGEAFRLLESYLPVEGCPLPAGLPEAVLAVNAWLRPALIEAEDFSRADGRVVDGPAGVVVDHLAANVNRPRPSGSPPPARPSAVARKTRGRVFFLGFGAYVRDQVLHHFANEVRAAVDHRAGLMRGRLKADFPLVTTFDDIAGEITAASEPLVIVATYHSDHAPLALRVLDANPSARVFVEKPATVSSADAERVLRRIQEGAWLDVGYNRRWAPLTGRLLAECARLPRPLVASVVVQELTLPPTHWYFWPNQGTRVTGNACHWIDLLHCVMGGSPEQLTLTPGPGDTISLGMRWSDGSVANLLATDRGASLQGVTERIEVRGGGTTLVLDDYRRLHVHGPRGMRTVGGRRRDKGHDAMYRDLRRRWLTGGLPRYPAGDIVPVARVVETATRMLANGEPWRRVQP